MTEIEKAELAMYRALGALNDVVPQSNVYDLVNAVGALIDAKIAAALADVRVSTITGRVMD